ncbi:hypothetical protein BBP40_009989 [Aspergillus hancockii]|nr:hypothetical protein BBP40_009989 [Aspergillus hancockii]
MPSFGNFLHTQLILRIPTPTTSFASKTVIVTGASSGLGKEAAQHIVRLGASKVILGCRNTSKGNNAKREIEATLRCSPDIIEVWELDIETPASIAEFVEKTSKLRRLDVLISNAGIQTIEYHISYGTERTLAVNVIGTFLLALQLIPKLRATARTYNVTPHMTFVGSALYDVAKYPTEHGGDIFAWFGDKRHVNMMDNNQYNLSKLLLAYGIIKLSSIVNPITDKSRGSTPIVINSLDPCFCKTELTSELTGGFKAVFKIFEWLFARSAEEGSRLVVIAATAGRKTHGGYMRAGALQKYAPIIASEDGVKRTAYVWDAICKKLEELQPGITAVASSA